MRQKPVISSNDPRKNKILSSAGNGFQVIYLRMIVTRNWNGTVTTINK